MRHSYDPRFFRKTENTLASKLAYELYVRMDGGTVEYGNYSMSNKSMSFILLNAAKCMCSGSCCYKMCPYRIQNDSASSLAYMCSDTFFAMLITTQNNE